MALYDDAFGLTTLRLAVVVAAVWMGTVLVMTAARDLGVGKEKPTQRGRTCSVEPFVAATTRTASRRSTWRRDGRPRCARSCASDRTHRLRRRATAVIHLPRFRAARELRQRSRSWPGLREPRVARVSRLRPPVPKTHSDLGASAQASRGAGGNRTPVHRAEAVAATTIPETAPLRLAPRRVGGAREVLAARSFPGVSGLSRRQRSLPAVRHCFCCRAAVAWPRAPSPVTNHLPSPSWTRRRRRTARFRQLFGCPV